MVQSLTANVLLALGASPAMVVEPQEAAQFSALADGLLINVGTLNALRAESMRAAVAAANQAGKPWTLDPVAVGALSYRTAFAKQLLDEKPAAIRGNASEIMALSGLLASGRGVDSGDDSLAALPAARELAQRSGAVVAVTGAVDYVTDGQRDWAIEGGSPLMTRVVGTGCALSAVVAAFCALPGDRLDNAATACRVMSHCGGLAARKAGGPGSFTPAFLDALYQLRGGMKRINALTIAGTDPSGGAGIQADLKAFSALGAYGTSVITALVAQNTRGVQSVYYIDPAFVAAQLDSVFSDVRIDSVKIGMLANADIVQAVAERLRHYRPEFVVLDTVMLAKSGDPLLAPEAVASIRRELLPLVSIITPNLPEAAALLACAPVEDEAQMREQAGAAGDGLPGGADEGRPPERKREPGLAV